MTSRLGVITEDHVAHGFRLAGVAPNVVGSPEAAAALLDEMVSEGDWGVVLVQEDLLPEGATATWQRTPTGLPIVIPFPAPSRERLPGEAEAYVTELLRQAIGYRVRLR